MLWLCLSKITIELVFSLALLNIILLILGIRGIKITKIPLVLSPKWILFFLLFSCHQVIHFCSSSLSKLHLFNSIILRFYYWNTATWLIFVIWIIFTLILIQIFATALLLVLLLTYWLFTLYVILWGELNILLYLLFFILFLYSLIWFLIFTYLFSTRSRWSLGCYWFFLHHSNTYLMTDYKRVKPIKNILSIINNIFYVYLISIYHELKIYTQISMLIKKYDCDLVNQCHHLCKFGNSHF